MPTYEYRCVRCNHRFELSRDMEERNNIQSVRCPECEYYVVLVASVSNFVFKGGV